MSKRPKRKPIGDARLTEEPVDRLTKLGGELTELFRTLEGTEGVRCIVMLNTDTRGAVATAGYKGANVQEANVAAMVDMFGHLKAMFNANGQELDFLPIHKIGRG